MEIWRTGYSVTEQRDGARLLGNADGATLREACDALAERDAEFRRYYDPIRLTFWGCSLHDNEADARRAFG
jgi:hypothetical protein